MTAQKRARSSDYIRGAPTSLSTNENSRVMIGALQDFLIMAAGWQLEMMNFASKRLIKDGKTMREIMDCKNSADATEIQSHWMQEALQDYATESTKLLSFAMRVTEGEAQLGNGHDGSALHRAGSHNNERASRSAAE